MPRMHSHTVPCQPNTTKQNMGQSIRSVNARCHACTLIQCRAGIGEQHFASSLPPRAPGGPQAVVNRTLRRSSGSNILLPDLRSFVREQHFASGLPPWAPGGPQAERKISYVCCQSSTTNHLELLEAKFLLMPRLHAQAVPLSSKTNKTKHGAGH